MRMRERVVCSMQPSSEYMQLHFSKHKLFFVHLHIRFTSIFAKSWVSRYTLHSATRIWHVRIPYLLLLILIAFNTCMPTFQLRVRYYPWTHYVSQTRSDRVVNFFLVYTFSVTQVLFSKTNWTFSVLDGEEGGYFSDPEVIRVTLPKFVLFIKTRCRNISKTRAISPIRFDVMNNARSA